MKPEPCPKCGNPHRSHLEDRKMIFCGQCGWMEADGVPEFSYASCSRCGRVPKARVACLGPDENTLHETMMLWTCCGITGPVPENEALFWCQVYLAQDHHKRRLG